MSSPSGPGPPPPGIPRTRRRSSGTSRSPSNDQPRAFKSERRPTGNLERTPEEAAVVHSASPWWLSINPLVQFCSPSPDSAQRTHGSGSRCESEKRLESEIAEIVAQRDAARRELREKRRTVADMEAEASALREELDRWRVKYKALSAIATETDVKPARAGGSNSTPAAARGKTSAESNTARTTTNIANGLAPDWFGWNLGNQLGLLPVVLRAMAGDNSSTPADK